MHCPLLPLRWDCRFHTALLWSLAPLLAALSRSMAALLPLLGALLAVLRNCIPYSGKSHNIAALPRLPGAPLAMLLVVLLLALAQLLNARVPWLSNTGAHFEQCKLAGCQQARWDQKLDCHLVLSRAHPFDRTLCPSPTIPHPSPATHMGTAPLELTFESTVCTLSQCVDSCAQTRSGGSTVYPCLPLKRPSSLMATKYPVSLLTVRANGLACIRCAVA